MIPLNPGYVSLGIVLIVLILAATGWRPYLAPDTDSRKMAIVVLLLAAVIPTSLWLSLVIFNLQLHVHASACIVIIAAFLIYLDPEEVGYKVYLVLSALLIATIWGFTRMLYSYDPVFFWLSPSWDSPIAGGLLCSAFSSQVKHQFGMLVWGAVFGEVLHAALMSGTNVPFIGSLAWWDSFLIAIVTARICSMMLLLMRLGISKLSLILWRVKGGRSS
ncbi:YphA family membrane protein [Paenibacillus sp. sgz302251]|uniref:YphA family membrane protein n=1 Tax=Paenibacillus sp. sgz302251 TaxID=3414493 RepID=UPI003C79A689